MQHNDETIRHAREATLRFLSFRLRSVAETRTFLRGKHVPEDVIDAAISELQDMKLLDDRAFSRWWITSRIHGGWGPKRVAQELHIKGINKDIVDEEMKQTDWADAARTLLEKEHKRFASLPPLKRQQHMTRLLLGRGFIYDHIARLVDELARNR